FNQGVFVRNFNTTVAILLVFFAKITISLINSNYITIYGAGADAKGFLRRASFIVQNKLEINLLTTGSDLFENYLAFIFNITGISQFSGEMLSILVFVIATSYLLKIAENLYGPSYNTHLVYLFGLLPSMLIYTSIIMREPYQILFFLMSVYYFIEILNKQKVSLRLFLKFFISILVLGMLHNGLLALTFILLTIFLNQILKNNVKLPYLVIRIMVITLVLFMFIGLLNILGISTEATEAMFNGDIGSYIEGYRDGSSIEDARARYGVELNTNNVFTVMLTFPLVFFNYMLAPFPWQISSLLDIYAVVENIFRLALILLGVKFIKSTKSEAIPSINQVMILFLLMEVLWSLGTVNWGTAIRHHLISYGLILLLAIPRLIKLRKQ